MGWGQWEEGIAGTIINYVHLYDGILHSRKKEGAPNFVTAWMELESIMLSEISQAVKDKYHMTSPLSGT